MTEKKQDYGEIVPTETMRLGALAVSGPSEVIERASAIATQLAQVIRERGLAMKIRNQEYVRVEGWNVLGAMLGVLPKERTCRRLEDGGYEASVDLIRTSDGAVVGGASALCGTDEKRWAEMPEYARRSMALTRATGKAFRLGFSWIIALAGYEPTPYEEMQDVVEGEVVTGKQAVTPDDWRGLRDKHPVKVLYTEGLGIGASEEEIAQALVDAKGDAKKALSALQKLHVG